MPETETPQTIIVDYKGDAPDTTWTNCTNIVELVEPDRLRFTGTKGEISGTWTIPFSSINSWVKF